jgi:hypothetical protein
MGRMFKLAVLLAALLPLPLLACSCLPPGTAQQELERSARVFHGRVVSIDRRTERDGNWFTHAVAWIRARFGAVDPGADPGAPYRRVTFSVMQTFKGPPARRLKVSTGIGGGDCGYPFEQGQDYVVYASGSEDDPVVGICSLTGPAGDPASGLDILRGGS